MSSMRSATVSIAVSTLSNAASASLPTTGIIEIAAPATDAVAPTKRIGVLTSLVKKQPLSMEVISANTANLVRYFIKRPLFCFVISCSYFKLSAAMLQPLVFNKKMSCQGDALLPHRIPPHCPDPGGSGLYPVFLGFCCPTDGSRLG